VSLTRTQVSLRPLSGDGQFSLTVAHHTLHGVDRRRFEVQRTDTAWLLDGQAFPSGDSMVDWAVKYRLRGSVVRRDDP